VLKHVNSFADIAVVADGDADRLPSIKLQTTRRINGDCLATIMTLSGGIKRRKKTQEQDQVMSDFFRFDPHLAHGE